MQTEGLFMTWRRLRAEAEAATDPAERVALQDAAALAERVAVEADRIERQARQQAQAEADRDRAERDRAEAERRERDRYLAHAIPAAEAALRQRLSDVETARRELREAEDRAAQQVAALEALRR